MNFMANIGSVITPILTCILAVFIVCKIVHSIALKFYWNYYWRKIGMAVETYQMNLIQDASILFIESFFELSFGTIMHLTGQIRHWHDWKGFYFNSASDVIATTLSWITLVLCFVYTAIPFIIVFGYKDEKRAIMIEKFGVLFDGLKTRGYCGLFLT